jgi:hypothetical protein
LAGRHCKSKAQSKTKSLRSATPFSSPFPSSPMRMFSYQKMADSGMGFNQIRGTRFSMRLLLSYAFDWIVLIVVAGVATALGVIPPKKRPFSLVDPDISYVIPLELDQRGTSVTRANNTIAFPSQNMRWCRHGYCSSSMPWCPSPSSPSSRSSSSPARRYPRTRQRC